MRDVNSRDKKRTSEWDSKAKGHVIYIPKLKGKKKNELLVS